jgi:SAM-dependent methyltransferase
MQQSSAVAERVAADTPRDRSALGLCCPRCKTDLVETQPCDVCGFELKREQGIVIALDPKRLKHYERFTTEYQSIRAAEGRGSEGPDYYLGLPHVDATGHNSGQWKIRAKSYEYLVRNILPSAGEGRYVLDLGAGNCWLSHRLAQRGHNTVAVDLLTNAQDGLGAAVHYERSLGARIPRFQAEIQHLPFQAGQFDVAIFNASFHYSENYELDLQEVFHCMKPGGFVVICDSPWYSQETHGQRMVEERHASYRERFKTSSDSLKSMEFLTDERLDSIAAALSINWTMHQPFYGWQWLMRPWLAKIRGRREPSQFRIYVAKRNGD